jgi:hypothetical protein
MSKKVDKEMIRILEQEIKNVYANRHMDKDYKQAKIKELKSLIEEEREKSYA